MIGETDPIKAQRVLREVIPLLVEIKTGMNQIEQIAAVEALRGPYNGKEA